MSRSPASVLERLVRASAAALVAVVQAGCRHSTAPARPSAARSLESSAPALELTHSEPEREDEQNVPSRAWLGVRLSAVEGGGPGVLVRDVVPSSPAARVGIGVGDVILSVDGQAVNEPETLSELIGTRRSGERVAISFMRGAARRLVAALLLPMPSEDELMKKTYVGQPAPALVGLTSVQGSLEPKLAAFRGRVVVLEFWATWCSVCRMMVPVLNDWHERYGAQGVGVLGITSESVGLASQAADSLGMLYPLASDDSGRTTMAYRALAVPTLFVLDTQGVVRDVMVGYSSERLQELEQLIRRLIAPEPRPERAFSG